MHLHRQLLGLLLSLLSLLTLIACTQQSGVQVLDLTLTDQVDAAGRPVRALAKFAVSTERIYAVAVVSGASPGARLQARWYLAGKLVQESPPLTLPDSVSRYADFSLFRRGSMFPAGRFRVDLLLDGRSLKSMEFVIS